jgi:AhpD family alkylhydroperoxidase
VTTVKILSDAEATPAARAVFDDIRQTRKTDFVNNAWRAMANHPSHLQRQWATAKEVMAPGALDALTKEYIYLTVSIMNACEYCIHSHSHFARQKGMTPEMYSELLAVIDLATAGNRMMTAMQVPVDEAFKVT